MDQLTLTKPTCCTRCTAVNDMSQHFTHGSPQSRLLDDGMLDVWAIVGPPCTASNASSKLAELGITKVFFMDAGRGVDHDEVDRSRRRLVEEVLPAL